MKLSLHAKIVLVVGSIVSAALITIPRLLPFTGEVGPDIVVAFGRFHIIALHFPICLLLVIPLLELIGCIRPMHYFKEAVQSVLWLAIIFAIAACALGFMLASGEGAIGKLVEDHMWGGILTTILMFVALFIYELNLGQKKTGLYAAYLVVLFGSVASLTIGSHHGASLVHGEDYLYEKAPTFVKNMIGVRDEPVVQLNYESPVYHTLIEPIFEQHCYTCHSELKEKGLFRMDTFEHLLKGGKSEIAGVAPWDLEKSAVYQRIILPLNEKKVMPPKESAPLNREQLALIQWWIEGGASETQTIDELSFELYPDEVEAIITARIDSGEDAAEPLDLETFQMVSKQVKVEFGMDVIRYSQQLEDGVYVVTRNAKKSLPEDAFQDLEPIASHVISINLWRRELTPAAFTTLSTFPRLSELHLSESNVASSDLAALSVLRKIETLNLFGTSVGDESIEALSTIRSLRTLHLYQSQFTDAGVAQLQQALPRCEILYTFETPLPEPTEPAATEEVATVQ